MAGCTLSKHHKGRCLRCSQSARVTANKPSDKYIGWLWCYKYDNLCKRVAWNCNR